MIGDQSRGEDLRLCMAQSAATPPQQNVSMLFERCVARGSDDFFSPAQAFLQDHAELAVNALGGAEIRSAHYQEWESASLSVRRQLFCHNEERRLPPSGISKASSGEVVWMPMGKLFWGRISVL